MENSIRIPDDVMRISGKKSTKFITERRNENIRCSSEYREDRAKVKRNRMIARHNVFEAEDSDAAFQLALSFLSPPAALENSVLKIICEINRVAKELDESLRKCKIETVEALETFFHS